MDTLLFNTALPPFFLSLLGLELQAVDSQLLKFNTSASGISCCRGLQDTLPFQPDLGTDFPSHSRVLFPPALA